MQVNVIIKYNVPNQVREMCNIETSQDPQKNYKRSLNFLSLFNIVTKMCTVNYAGLENIYSNY